MDDLLRNVKASPTAPGYDEILIPGDPERRKKEKLLKEGIFISEETWREITKVVTGLGLDLERILR